MSADGVEPKALGACSVANSAAVYARGRVQGLSMNLLLDTGSAVTLLHSRLLDKVGNGKLAIEKAGERVVSANG